MSANKTSFVYGMIKSAIIANEYKAGDIISENSLVKTYGVSRTPVREAIKILEREGLVQIYKGVGVFVKHVTLKEVRDTCDLRILLECYAMEHACERILPWQIQEIIDQWEELKQRILNSGQYTRAEITQLDVITHDLVFECACNTILANVHNTMHENIGRYQAMFTHVVDNDIKTVQQHIDLLTALADKDKDRYKKILKDQVYSPILLLENNPMN